MMNTTIKNISVLLIATTVLSACGGGGGGDSGSSNGGGPSVPTNQKPVANAGADQSDIQEETVVMLDGSQSTDPDGDSLTYSWIQSAGPIISFDDATSPTPSFEAPSVNTPQDVTFELVVSDGSLTSDADSMTVTIVPRPNQLPISDAGNDLVNVPEKSTVTLDGAGSTDPDGDALTYQWQQVSGTPVTLSDTTDPSPTFVAPDINNSEVLAFELTVDDGQASSSADQVSITVVPDDTAPTVTIKFPTPSVMTSKPTIQVAGTASDNLLVASVSVNGTLATSDDNFATWTADVPLIVGSNTLTVQVNDASTNSSVHPTPLSVFRQQLAYSLFGAVVDQANDVLYTLDKDLLALQKIDLSTGAITIVSDQSTGSEAMFVSPIDLALDLSNNRALVLDNNLDALLSVDLTNGERSIIASDANGSGVALDFPNGIAFDPLLNRVLVVDTSIDGLIAIDLNTGDRSIISDATIGTGDNFESPFSLAIDFLSGTAFVGANVSGSRSLVAVDLISGDRTTITSPFGVNLSEISLDSANNRIISVEGEFIGNGSVVAIDITTGDITTLSPNTNPIKLSGTYGSSLDTQNNVIYSVFGGDLYKINLSTGDRSSELNQTFGAGPTIRNIPTIIPGKTDDTLLVSSYNSILEFNINDNNRSIVASDTVGSGPELEFIEDIKFDIDNDTLYTLNLSTNSIMSVNFTTGDRSILASPTIGNGPDFFSVEAFGVDMVNNRAYVVDHSNSWASMHEVDLATGDRTTLNVGVELSYYNDIELDLTNRTAYIADPNLDYLLQIDLNNGEATIISKGGFKGAGPHFGSPLYLQLDLTNNRAFIADERAEAIFEVDLTSGDRRIIANFTASNEGDFIQRISEFVYQENTGLIFAVTLPNSVMVLNPDTGYRTFLSKP